MFIQNKPRKFDHPLWAQAVSLSEEEAVALLPAIRAGDKDAKEAMTKGFLRMGLTIVGRYYGLLKSKRLIDDLVSGMLAGLWQGVQALENTTGKLNPASFVAEGIHQGISGVLDEDCFFKVRALNRARKSNRQEAVVPLNQITEPEAVDLILNNCADREGAAETLETELDDCLENDLEHSVVKLKKQGYTDKETADALSIGVKSVQVIKQDLYVRLKRKLLIRNDE